MRQNNERLWLSKVGVKLKEIKNLPNPGKFEDRGKKRNYKRYNMVEKRTYQKKLNPY